MKGGRGEKGGRKSNREGKRIIGEGSDLRNVNLH